MRRSIFHDLSRTSAASEGYHCLLATPKLQYAAITSLQLITPFNLLSWLGCLYRFLPPLRIGSIGTYLATAYRTDQSD